MIVNGYEIKPKANLSGADLRGADLRGANLHRANLSGADLRGADLRRANLHRANLSGADLRGVDLRGVDLYGANPSGADLRGADLRGVDLYGADLYGADLHRANLRETCLDPTNKANGNVAGFEQCTGSDGADCIIGYRSRSTPDIGQYLDGRTYGADFFSTSNTECHPGLYLWPTLEQATGWSGNGVEIIKVLAHPEHTHKAGTKWRTRWFQVIGRVER